MSYLVMECYLSHAVVLAEDGRFLNVANLHYQVGQTVTEVVEMRPSDQLVPYTPKQRSKSWQRGLLAAAACLLVVFTGLLQTTQTYASVYMTINPDVRIDVNRRNVVVGLEGINQDGRDLIEGYSYRHKKLDPVMDELVDRAIEMGYLTDGGNITLALDANSAQWVDATGSTLDQHLQEYLTEKLTVHIEITTASATDYDDTDYGPGSDGVSDYSDTDYGPGNDGVTDYSDTDYGPGNDGVTDYSDTDYGPDHDGATDYDDSENGDTPYED